MGRLEPKRVREEKEVDQVSNQPCASNNPPKVKMNKRENVQTLVFGGSPQDLESQHQTFGTSDKDFINKIVSELMPLNPKQSKLNDETKSINSLLATLHGIQPRDVVEGLIAAQMIGVHNLTMEFMSRSLHANATEEGVDRNVNRITKLLRLFNSQVETLNKYRNRGQQQVTVQHVQVNGGQAIVGQVNSAGGGKGNEKA